MTDEEPKPAANPATDPDTVSAPPASVSDPDTVSAPPASATDPDSVSAPAAPTAALPDSASTLAAALSRAEALAAATLKRAEIAERALAAAKKTIASYEKAAAELGARASALADALEKEKANRAALVGHVLSPAAAPVPLASGTPHLDAMRALRTPAERENYFRAHHAEIKAEARR